MEFRIFDMVMYDIQKWKGEASMPFFAESDDSEPSVSENTEDEILKWIVSHRTLGKFLIKQFFADIPGIRAYFGLTHPFVISNQKPGDIDLFLIHPLFPDKSIAFEVKRVKAVAINDEVSRVNGIEKIRKGVIQANKYQSLGFHQTYLMLIILNDGRAKTSANVMLRSAKTDNVQRIYSIPWNEPLHPDVGIVYVDLNQFTGRSITQTGSMGVCVDKGATPLEQTHGFTKKVETLLFESQYPYVNFK